MKRPLVHPATDWRGETWLVENAQTGRARPTSSSKRRKAKRAAGRRS